jgi:beta-lactamase class D
MLFYDENSNDYITNSKSASGMRSRPGSIFHIFNALMFYELGIVKDSTTHLKWDSIERTFNGYDIPVWNKDTYLAEAFRNGTDWYFKELSSPIEYKLFKKYLKKSKYGNLSSTRLPAEDFWNGGRGRLKIRLKDHIKFLRRFRDGKLPFDDDNVAKVKELMLEKSSESYSLYGKVGLSNIQPLLYDEVIDLGWYIGFIETEDNVYYFVSYIEKSWNDDREDFFELRKQVVHKSLKHLYGIDVND